MALRQQSFVTALRQYLGERPCDLQNIEVYYRLGLAYLAKGRWEDAVGVFDKVDEASAGYRDAWKRAEEIRAWQAAIAAWSA